MATESSRSSPSVDSYVGSLISLISKSEIRYEGILVNINTAESSIGLRNVKPFGTEGRKKEGPQLPPSDKVYEYILFRGSDIKDLQVKSLPPVQVVQSTEPIYNDPAIIQSHYPQEAATSTSLPCTDIRSQQDLSSYTSGGPKSTPQSSVPLYQPSGSLGSWGSSYPYPTSNGILSMPKYMQGFYGASDGLQTQQQSLLQSPPGLLMHPSMQQTMQYPALSASLPTKPFNLPASPVLDTPPPLLPSFSTSTLNLHSSLLPAQSSALTSDSSTTLMSNKAPIQALRPAAMNTTSLQLVTPPTNVLDKNVFATSGAVQPKTADSALSYNSVLKSEHPVTGTSSSFMDKGLAPSLVTPNQFLQPGPTIGSSSQSLQSVQKDVEVVQVSSTEQRIQTFPETQAPIFPLPTPLDYKVRGDPSHSHHQINRGGRGRARGHWASHNVSSFTEDFDFVAMNEKFNKDEVWGHLGKANTTEEDGYSQDRDDGTSNFETKPVYVKDDFFDSLSSNTSGGSNNGRSKFSELMKLDTETFGNFARHRGGRGFGRSGRGFDRGGRGFGRSGRGFATGDHVFDRDGYGNSRGGHGFGRSGFATGDHVFDRDGYGNSRGGHGFGRSGQSRGAHIGGAHYGRSYGYNERGGWRHHAA